MSHLDGKAIDDVLQKDVTILKPATINFTDRGDADESYEGVETTAEIQIQTSSDFTVQSGVLNLGDAIGFFRGSEDIKSGYKIMYDGRTWRVTDVFPERVGKTIVFFEARLVEDLE